MKHIIRYSLVLLLLLCGSRMTAQESHPETAEESNILSIGNVSGSMGSQVALPIHLNNTCNDIVAAQFRLTLPAGLTLATESAQFGVRTSNHSAVVQKNGNSYVVMVFSPNNSIVAGNAGQLMTIGLNIGNNLTPGGDYAVTLSDVLLSNKAGENVMTSFGSGTLHIADVPDFVVTDVQTMTSGTVAPGSTVSVAWIVKNQGGLTSNGGWSEQVSLVGSGRTLLLGTVYHDGTLEAGATISRQADMLIPALPGIDGQAKVQVKLLPHADSGEYASQQANNTTQATETVALSKQLTLTVPSMATEADGRMKCVLSRSGSWATAQTFGISVEGDGRLSAPATVTIPRGQSSAAFYVNIIDDTQLNADSHFAIKASGCDYDAVTARTELEDNEYPPLVLTASKTNITEGETFQLTISVNSAVSQPLEVFLFCEKPARFNYPSSVVIPAGERIAIVDVEAMDDSDVSETLSVAFSAEAARYTRCEDIVLLADNDMPDIDLTLTPSTVSESAGATAILGTVKKMNHKESKITVKLTDDTNGRFYYSASTLVLEKDVEEAQFTIGVTDNATVDGDITAKVTAAIWISSCGCSANGSSGGSITKNITVLDDDGASLKLTSAKTTMLEGSQNNTLTIERNTSVATEVHLTLNSNHDDILTYNHNVTIPAGQKFVSVNVVVASNNVQNDSQTVSFTATAEGYSTGTCWVMISDQTLPDVTLSELTTNSQSYKSGGQMEVSVKVTNNGNAVYPAPSKILLYLNNNSSILSPLYLTEDLQPGTSAVVSKTVTLPASIGGNTLKAEINHDHAIEELLYANNMSENVTIELLPLFTATVAPTKNNYTKGETVTLQGRATGDGTANAEVEVYIIQGGTRLSISAMTDAEGNFNTKWEPYSSMIGQFAVGACFPGERLTTEQATINILGLRRTSNGYITCETLVGETYNGTIVIENPGVLSQTFSGLEVLEQPANCEVNFTKPASVAGGSTATIAYTLNGNAVTECNDWENMKIRLTTAEGSALDIDMYYYCRSPRAVLEATPSSFNTTMVKGMSRDYSLMIANRGKGATGKITLSLPDVDWMTAVTPLEMGSLEYEESAEVVLRLTPTDDMPLNVPLTGRIALNCENGNGITVPYRIEPVSESTGTLVVDVTDEYTYYAVIPDANGSRMMTRALVTQSGPHVAGANIEVRHPVTNAIVASGQTGEDGKLSIDLPEGYYTLKVTESNHDSYSGTILIDPGVNNLQDIFIGFKAITYSWDVVETEVEDEYQIVTTVKYETNVPKPVVIITLPKEEPQPNSIIPIVVTNKGLITATNPVFQLTTTGGYEVEVLNGDELKSLAPQQSYVFYALFRRTTSQSSRRRAPNDGWDGSCKGLYAQLWLNYICGTEDRIIDQIAAGRWGNCGATGGGGGGYVGGGSSTGSAWGGPGSGGGPVAPYTVAQRNTTVDTYTPDVSESTTTPTNCNPYLVSMGKALRDCAHGIIKDCTPDAIGAVHDVFTKDWDDLKDRIRQFLTRYGADELNSKEVKSIWNHLLKELLNFLADLDEASNKIGCANSIGSCVAALQIIATGGASSRSMKSIAKTSGNTAIDIFLEQFDMLRREIEALEQFQKELYGDDSWLESDELERKAFLTALSENIEQGELVLTDEIAALRPTNVTLTQAISLVDRIKNTMSADESCVKINLDQLEEHLNIMKEVETYAEGQGYENTSGMLQSSYQNVIDFVDSKNNSVCATITLQFSQTMTMTRQAFRGTLTVSNGHDTTAMQDVKLNLEIRDEDGNLATSHEFQISTESLKQFSGELSLTSGWTLDAQQTGSATVLFIPTKYAALTENKVYSFGGTLSYVDPFTGITVARELYPVSLTVKPSPNLELTYFMQRDIWGDDPLTLDVVEPSKPAEFSLIIKNNGNGEASNVRMVTDQPRIVENEKGLFVDFTLLSSILNGKEKTLALGQSVATDFGTIAPQSTTYAQWMFQSTLLGNFIEYDVKATHVSSYDNPDLSLLDTVTVHELIHGFDTEVANGQTGRAFLVNDMPDANDLPDVIYFTDGTQQSLTVAANSLVTKTSNTEYLLTVNGTAGGWNYGVLADPTVGRQKLIAVVRQSDGKQLPVESFWQTDRTLRDGKEWLYENKLHFATNLSTAQEQYVLTFEPVPDVILNVERINGVPSINDIAQDPVQSVEVIFNKDIVAETFTTDDLQLNCQGEKLDATQIVISQTGAKHYALDLSALTLSDGYYTLTVQTAGITDSEGYQGKTGCLVEWVQYSEQVSFVVQLSPEDGGVVTPAERRADYDATVSLTATPNDGYVFAGWRENDVILSRDPVYELTVVPGKVLTAVFVPKQYYVTIDYESREGEVTGGGTGIYPYGTQMELSAVPTKYYTLKGWRIDGELVENNAGLLMLVVNRALHIEPVFQPAQPGDANGDGKVNVTDIMAVANCILRLPMEVFNERSADVNGDGYVNVTDIMGIANIILGVDTNSSREVREADLVEPQ